MEHRKIYNRPLSNSNYFILNETGGSTEWVSYHLIPNRVKVEIDVEIPIGGHEDQLLLKKINIKFDYSVDEKSVSEKINDWLTILKGRYTNKILQINSVCINPEQKNPVEFLRHLLHETNFLFIKHYVSNHNDEALDKSYQGISKILAHISEDIVKNGFPELTESF